MSFEKAESNYLNEPYKQSLSDAEDELMKDKETLRDAVLTQFSQEYTDYLYEGIIACRKGDPVALRYFNRMVNTAIDKELDHDT